MRNLVNSTYAARAQEIRTQGQLLETRKLSKHFAGLTAVTNLSFAIGQGQLVGLIGPNGAGKSTTFNLISGFLKPSGGQLLWQGADVTGRSPRQMVRLGLVRTFQHNSFVGDMSVYENILIGAYQKARDKDKRQLIIHDVAKLTGLIALLDTPAGVLPHGSQRLLSLAIALASEPTLLCLDEPLTGLQGREVQSVLALLEVLRAERGITILLVEHNMKAVMSICEKIYVLDHGQLLAAGTPAQIIENPDVINAYLGRKR